MNISVTIIGEIMYLPLLKKKKKDEVLIPECDLILK